MYFKIDFKTLLKHFLDFKTHPNKSSCDPYPAVERHLLKIDKKFLKRLLK